MKEGHEVVEGFLLSLRVLFLSPFPRAVMKPICYAGTLSDMQRFSDSDTGTQIIKGPFRRRWRQLPFAGTPYYTVRRTDYFLFHDTSNTGPTTGDGFHPESSAGPSDARRMEGGVAGLR